MSQPNWANTIGKNLIKDIQLTIGNDVIYDSTQDKDKEEKLKLLEKIDELKKFGIDNHKIVYLNDSYEEIKFCYEMMKFEYDKLTKQ